MSELRSILERATERVSPPPDLFERLERRHRREVRMRRAAVAVVALAIAAAGITVPVLALRPSPSVRPLGPGPSGKPVSYVITLPSRAVPVPGEPGHYQIVATTNLPEGTVTIWDTEGPQSGGGGTGPAVMGGRLVLRFVNNQCVERHGGLVSPRFSLTLSVMPVDFGTNGPGGPRPMQPASVFAVLGSQFQRLTGPQVTHLGGVGNILTVKGRYQFSGSDCTAKLVPVGKGKVIQVPVTPTA